MHQYLTEAPGKSSADCSDKSKVICKAFPKGWFIDCHAENFVVAAFAYCDEKQIVEVYHRFQKEAEKGSAIDSYLLCIPFSNGFYLLLTDEFKNTVFEILKDIFNCEITEAQKYVFDKDRWQIESVFGFERRYAVKSTG